MLALEIHKRVEDGTYLNRVEELLGLADLEDAPLFDLVGLCVSGLRARLLRVAGADGSAVAVVTHGRRLEEICGEL